jgi:hypothetical protein
MVWWELSIDLVAAALRQADFASKITAPDRNDLDTPSSLETACTRYHRFLGLFRSGAAELRVPTMDIDLCWHTHQLFPAAYRNWCIQHLDLVINHDDTIALGDLNEGLRSTSLAWFKEYGGPYTTEDLRKDYVTGVKKVGGVLFPPYGFHVWNKARKLDQSRMDAGSTQLGSVDRDIAQYPSVQLYGPANPPARVGSSTASSRSDQSRGWAPGGPMGMPYSSLF